MSLILICLLYLPSWTFSHACTLALTALRILGSCAATHRQEWAVGVSCSVGCAKRTTGKHLPCLPSPAQSLLPLTHCTDAHSSANSLALPSTNSVNRRLGKPVFNCSLIEARWGGLDCGDDAGCSLELGRRR